MSTIPCRLCGAVASELFRDCVLDRHDVGYFHCPACDLIQTETPYWLDEAYAGGAMNRFDTGAIARNVLCAELTEGLGRLLAIGADEPCGDFGGGHGVFVRMMRDRGFDFRLCDKYADNIFARGFEADPSNRFALLCSFEVLEHLSNPVADLATLFAPGHDHVLVGTVLHRGHRPGWWYYCPTHGQHVAFYSGRTMQHVAERHGYSVIHGPAYTLFSRQPLTGWREAIVRRLLQRTKPNRNWRGINLLRRVMGGHPSLVTTDHQRLLNAA